MNALFNPQFSYCPVICIFYSRVLNSKIYRIHERCLRIIHNNKTSTFNEILEKDNSVSIHYRNVEYFGVSLRYLKQPMECLL